MADAGPPLRNTVADRAEDARRADQERLALFTDEVARFALRFQCEACAHVVPSTRACSMAYPNAMLRGELVRMPVVCKYFELGETEIDD